MPEELTFTKICGVEAPIMDVVFIHGLTGDPKETWISEDAGEYWPTWLCNTFPSIAVYSLGYPASLFEKWAKKEMDLFERAANALEYMAGKEIGVLPVTFICHSLGGILAKQIIRTSCDSDDEDWKKVSSSIRLLIFLATPHSGASIASVLKTVIPRFSSKSIDLLSNGSGLLDDLNNHYRTFANNNEKLKTVVYAEKFKTKNTTLVVSKESSDPGVSGTQPVLVDKNHINISKPCNTEDIIYVGIQRHIKHALTEHGEAPGEHSGGAFHSDNYGEKSEEDRRDLLEKLIASGREHEYSEANSYQNKFAQNYMKLGLYTDARETNDKLLSEVEQQFITHVYHPLICKGHTDDEIRDALQSKVIDSIFSKHKGEKGFTKKTVLSALYFLTEQCHIRWDAEK